MIDVQKRQLFPTLLSDNKHRIAEIQNLGNVKDIQDESKWWIGMVEGVARNDRVVVLIRLNRRLNAHIRAQHNLNNVVQELEWVKTRNRREKRHDDLQKN